MRVSNRSVFVWAAAGVLFFTAVAEGAASADCGVPAVMSDGWTVSSPAKQDLDQKMICSIGPGFAKLRDADPHGVVVIRHGMLVYERYFAGDDRRGWTALAALPHDATTLHNMESISKGVVALIVGIAFDRGWLRDLDAPIFSFLLEYADLRTADKDRITVRHLLSMTSGLDWPERAVGNRSASQTAIRTRPVACGCDRATWRSSISSYSTMEFGTARRLSPPAGSNR
jgi:CubicO group peptidase (beta-lactamase class C family)